MNTLVPSPSIQGLVALQQGAIKTEEELLRLQMLWARIKSPSVARVMELKSRGLNPVVFRQTPMYQVPQLDQFIGKELCIGTAAVDRRIGTSTPETLEVGVPLEDLSTHELILGRSKAGKSRALLRQYRQLVQKPGISTIMFALEGSELRILPSLQNKNVIVLDLSEGGNCRYNPLTPMKNVSPEQTIADLLLEFSSQWLGPNSMNLLRPAMEQLIEGILAGNPCKFSDLAKMIAKTKQTELRDKVIGRLALIGGHHFDSTQPLDMDLIGRSHVIFLVEQLNAQATSFVVGDVVTKLMRWKRIARVHFSDVPPLTCLLIDEAQRVLPSAFLERDDLALLPLMSAAAQSRKLGIGLMLALQQVSLINDAFLANAGMILAGPLNNVRDTQVVRNALGLSPDQTAYYRTMQTRSFLMWKSGHPVFPVEIPDFPLSEEVPDAAFLARWNGEVIKNNPVLGKLLHQEQVNNDRKPPTITAVATSVPAPDGDDYQFLKCVNDHPCLPVTSYYNLLDSKFSLQKASRIRASLEELDHLRSQIIRHGGRGHCTGLEATEKGLKHHKLPKTLVYSRGADFPHTWAVYAVQRFYEAKRMTTKREHPLGNHPCDCFVFPNLAVEVALGNDPDQEAKGILADLQHAQVLVVGNSEEHFSRIRSHLPPDAVRHVKFQLLHAFLPKERKEESDG